MCGIRFILLTDASVDAFVSELLERRGPDYQACHSGWLCGQLKFLAHGYVLWMRGDDATRQPAVNESGDLLLWNGNIFDGVKVPDGVSDTSHLAALLSGASESAVVSTLSSVCGPWAVVLWQSAERRLWLGRDPLGRRSLLWNGSPGRLNPASVTLTSVGGRHRADLTEVPCLGLFSVHIPPDCESIADLRLRLHPWSHVTVPDAWRPSVAPGPPLESPAVMTVNPAVPDDELRTLLDAGGGLEEAERLPGMAAAMERFEAAMLAAVRRRVGNMPPVCASCLQSAAAAGSRPAACPHPRLAVLFSGGVDSMLVAAMADRCLPDDQPVDLLNVAFERPKQAQTPSKEGRSRKAGRGRPTVSGTTETEAETPSEYDVPDRVTGRDGWRELQTINPRRRWNFVEVNVTAAELSRWRAARVRHLISPLQTVLDDSIGCAVWFAARGAGVLAGDGPGRRPYQTQARVVLVGMGADEQLAGYGRHRSAFRDRSWPGLVAEIQTQLLAICERNLGRDDRVISDHGREARFPFLDESVVSLLSSLPIWLKAQPGPGWSGCDKLPIRLLTARCGAPAAARRTKRAIQFGSRIAKLESRTEKAADVCDRLMEAPADGGDGTVRSERVTVESHGGEIPNHPTLAVVEKFLDHTDLAKLSLSEPGGCDSNSTGKPLPVTHVTIIQNRNDGML
ncbi:asparagine synthetase domain-containing protein 1-like [Amphibalanus amphitrite]|uniref:asparagine synthetase domain-containing protein 1-like n=1 Tax=Amphibalanus amphitrite TaxID=1232801 RepID=UPI001C904F87|nr:asparagine synthetase domain-containing protein 1-like [Amphibalanus amphitrite]